jgi:hypothetical protein
MSFTDHPTEYLMLMAERREELRRAEGKSRLRWDDTRSASQRKQRRHRRRTHPR